MSTRADIILTDGENELYFYRHSDGYPEGALPTLEAFMEHVRAGRIRDNVSQAAGWLVIMGAQEGSYHPDGVTLADYVPTDEGYSGWKAGALEPTPFAPSADNWSQYVYTVNLKTKEVTYKTA